MAEVQLALQRGPAGFEKLVVVKLVHENLASQKAFVDMLLDEARVAALVKHPNVVDIYDLGEVEGRYFIAMEYLEGEPLLAVLRAGRDGQRLDVLSTARLIADTAEGLDAAHELRSMAGDPIGLVHHDVSLGNIVVLYNGQVKLVDFGVAKATQSATARTKVQGKFGYMAPEKLRGGPGDRRSDIWSLGCVLWEALTLKRLFKGGNDSDTMHQVLECPILTPSEVNGDVPVDFDAIVMRALDRDPDKRYPTAKAMAAEIEEVLRKHGYAAKNDMIARYMQATFQSHIDARKKLLQEVSSKGGASPDVLEAAFDDGALASGSPVNATGEFKRRVPSNTLAEHTPKRVLGSAPLVFPRANPAELAQFAAKPDSPEAPAAATTPARPRPITAGPAATTRAPAAAPIVTSGIASARAPVHDPGDEQTVVEAQARPARPRWVVYGLAGAGAILAVVIVTSVVSGGRGGEPASSSDKTRVALVSRDRMPSGPPAAAMAPDPTPTTAAPAPAVDVDAIEVQAGGEHPEGPVANAAGEPDGQAGKSHSSSARHVPTSRINADDAFKAGLQAWVRGDTRTALTLYKRALAANSGYAAAWRGAGLVYEKLGEKAAAHAAFQRYLQLAPNAPDAPSIRQRLESP
jgi:eukaryotic-like serine/threonine-protein kinase